MKALRSLAFVTNADKSGAPELARELIALAKAAGLVTQQTARRTIPHGWLKGYDACCVIGGDGTLLGVAHEAAGCPAGQAKGRRLPPLRKAGLAA